jgi:hypothetical protein
MAALDTQTKRMAAAVVALPFMLPGVFADATLAFGWRMAAAWSYPNELDAPAPNAAIVCMQPGDVFRIPRHVGDRYQLARQLGDTFRIPTVPGDVFRC